MNKIAVVNPASLIGQELRQELERRGGMFGDFELFASDEDEVGTLTEKRGAAAVVQRCEPGDLDDFQLVFLCGKAASWRPLLETLPAELSVVVVSPEAGLSDGQPIVAGVNSRDAAGGGVLVSPHPAVVILARLLAPLTHLGLRIATATVLQPASIFGQEGLDELFEQTRAILTFNQERPQEIFGRQLAFNTYPAPGFSDLTETLAAVLAKPELRLSAQLLQGGIFHGVAASVYVEVAPDPGAVALNRALEAGAQAAFTEPGDEPGPVEAAVAEEILAAEVRSAGRPGAYWLWAVMDNLTLGAARNAAETAEAVLGARVN
ncbi:MAG TPA: hypothetical protein PK413_04550 [Thermoanaerobaculia bacterium]|nr:hypothetical protein [Thermoanaerobaculia bacterium]